jgi:hypothetical protein
MFAKDKNKVGLPAGLMIINSKVLSWLAKAYGGFDYVFSQMPDDRKTFMVSYINYDREKDRRARMYWAQSSILRRNHSLPIIFR